MPVDFPWVPFALAFVIGGSVKGALGVGLPLIAVPLLSLWIPSPQAIAMLVVPVLSSNLWQAVEGGRFIPTLKRFRGLIAAQFIATVLTVRMTLAMTASQLNILLAFALLLAVALMAVKPTLRVNPKQEQRVGTAIGLFSGLLGGVSSLTGPVIITYLLSLKIDRDTFIGSISVIYLTGAVPLYFAMLWFGRVAVVDFAMSGVALMPMAIGLAIGKMLRQWLDEALFRKVLLGFLTLLALLLLLK
jgi:uncharacterized protein